MMISILILGFLAAAAECRPQNDGTIHTDLIPERRQAGSELTADMVALLLDGTDRQKDGTIHTDLIPERRQAGSDRIVGGSEVYPRYKYPYQVFMQANGYMCGGTIINKRYVLTAMHCLYDKSKNEHPVSKCSVVVGEHDIGDGLNEGGQVIEIRRFIKRYDYDSRNIVNDIALLELKEDIKFTENVKPACLPTDTSKTYVGQWGIISGWGGTVGYAPGERINQKTSNKLKGTSVKILSASECSDVTKGDSATRMCAFGYATDTCQGDSGGPMVVKENGKYTVVGVVSYGRGCASKYPGVYARVTNYLSWINSSTGGGDCSGGTSGGSSGGSTGGSTGGSSCPYTDKLSSCSEYKSMCSFVSDLCPKTCKC